MIKPRAALGGTAGPIHPPEISEYLLNSTIGKENLVQNRKNIYLKKITPSPRLLVPKSGFFVLKQI